MTKQLRRCLVFAIFGALLVGVVMEPRPCWGDSASSAPHATQQEARANAGIYSAAAAGPDSLTTTGNVRVTFAVASPIQAASEGLVTWVQTSGGTVTFNGRVANKGCLYDVQGFYTGGSGSGTPPPWYSAFDDRSGARIYLQVNNDGMDDDVVWYQDTGTLTVTVEGGSSSTQYTVTLTVTDSDKIRFDNTDDPSTTNVQVAGNGGKGSVTLYGKAPGRPTITAQNTQTQPSSPVATGQNIVVTVPKVDITRGGSPITGTTTNVIVGQKMSLSGVVQPAGVIITSKQWTVQGDPIKNYEQSVDSGKETPLAAADFKGDNLDQFFWVTGGNGREAKYEVVVGGTTGNAKATFNVLRPSASLSSQLTSNPVPVDIVPGPAPSDPPALMFGSPGTDAQKGITFNAAVTTGQDGAGKIAFTQLTITDIRQTLDPQGTKEMRTSNGAFVLDDAMGVQYDGTTSINANEQKAHSKPDTPGMLLLSSLKKRSANEQYQVFLMYQSNTPGSIWVTLRRLDWYWSGSASKNTEGQWSRDASTSPNNNPVSSDSTTLPKWENAFTKLGFVPEP